MIKYSEKDNFIKKLWHEKCYNSVSNKATSGSYLSQHTAWHRVSNTVYYSYNKRYCLFPIIYNKPIFAH